MNRSLPDGTPERVPADSPDAFAADCPVRSIVNDITSRWATLVLTALMTRPHRFSQLSARIGGISEKMLSQTLRNLTRDGLVRRDAAATVPVQVTYELTELGRDLTLRLEQLVRWVNHYADTIWVAQSVYDAKTSTPPPLGPRQESII